MLPMPRIVRPDPHRIRGTEFGSPVGPATRRSIKRNKELAEASNRKMIASSITGDSPVNFGDHLALDVGHCGLERLRRRTAHRALATALTEVAVLLCSERWLKLRRNRPRLSTLVSSTAVTISINSRNCRMAASI